MKVVTIVMTLLMAVMAGGCATQVREVSLDRPAKSAALEPQDVRRTVEKMVDSMLSDSIVIESVAGTRPVLDITEIKNRSTMHIDMNMITSSIRTKLIRSRLFRFMDRSTAASDLEFMNDQALNGLTDPSKAISAGQQSAAQMYLYGELSELRQDIDGVSDRYFKFNLNLKDLRSGEIIWTDEQEIRKEQTRSAFGL